MTTRKAMTNQRMTYHTTQAKPTGKVISTRDMISSYYRKSFIEHNLEMVVCQLNSLDNTNIIPGVIYIWKVKIWVQEYELTSRQQVVK